MKRPALTAVFILLFAGAACAGETGIINQAGPYEATMKFYLHPAHGFPGAAETPPTTASVNESANTRQAGKTSKHAGKIVGAAPQHETAKTNVSSADHVYP